MLVPTMLDAINISVYVLLKGILAIWACVVFCKQFMQKGSNCQNFEYTVLIKEIVESRRKREPQVKTC